MEGILWNHNLHYCDYKNLPLVSIESQINYIEVNLSYELAFCNLVGGRISYVPTRWTKRVPLESWCVRCHYTVDIYRNNLPLYQEYYSYSTQLFRLDV
jgi:hypothetical protein